MNDYFTFKFRLFLKSHQNTMFRFPKQQDWLKLVKTSLLERYECLKDVFIASMSSENPLTLAL